MLVFFKELVSEKFDIMNSFYIFIVIKHISYIDMFFYSN